VRNDPSQKKLAESQLAEFNHGGFVPDQIRAFLELTRHPDIDAVRAGDGLVLDVGGGHGLFASALQEGGHEMVRVVDTDAAAILSCVGKGIDAIRGDVLSEDMRESGQYICFNMILHHLVGKGERDNRSLQKAALGKWRGRFRYIFINEYVYESPVIDGLSTWLIWTVTSSRVLSVVAKALSTFIPSLRANTFGVGVRFRSLRGWRQLFGECELKEIGYRPGQPEAMALR